MQAVDICANLSGYQATESEQMSTATAPNLAASSATRSDLKRDRRGKWNRRRAWLDAALRVHQLLPSERLVAGLLASRSDDDGKPVYGTQVNMGAELGLSERTIRRCVASLAAVGLVRIISHPAVMDARGRFVRRPCNVYVLTLPPRADLAAVEAPRRVRKAGYCVVKPRSHPPDSHGLTTPITGGVPTPAPVEAQACDAETGEIAHEPTAEEHARGMASLWAALRGSPRPPVGP